MGACLSDHSAPQPYTPLQRYAPQTYSSPELPPPSSPKLPPPPPPSNLIAMAYRTEGQLCGLAICSSTPTARPSTEHTKKRKPSTRTQKIAICG